jgi:5-methylcytosine-specific restriction endonuclease McrA
MKISIPKLIIPSTENTPLPAMLEAKAEQLIARIKEAKEHRSERKRYVYRKQFFKQRKIVLKVSRHTCQICGKKANNVHHVNENTNDNDINNLLLLCRSCHSRIHHLK